MKYLAIDYGTKRVGTATSDATGLIASPYRLLANNQELIDNIKKLVETEKIEAIVLGLPKHMHNQLSEMANQVLTLKEDLSFLNIPIYTQDERRTSYSAESVLISANVSRAKRKELVDNMAATIILQTYLDSCNKR